MSLLEFTVYGAAVIEHCLIEEGFPGNVKTGAGFDIDHGTATSLLIYIIYYLWCLRVNIILFVTFLWLWP